MVDRLSKSESTLLLFGPQALSFDGDSFQTIRTAILKENRHHWISQAVSELSTLLEAIVKACPKLATRSTWAISVLEELDGWFRTGTLTSQDPTTLPNTLLTPLVVITQLLQYIQYLEVLGFPLSRGEHPLPASVRDHAETFGFCTGLLSALAVSSSHTRDELEKYGSVAIRLGMLVGLVVDTQEIPEESGPSISIATMWKSTEEKHKMLEILAKYPEVYISVYYDANRATVTSPTEIASTIQQELNAANLTATEIALRGRFHWNGYRDYIDALIALCNTDTRFQFPSTLALPSRSNSNGDPITTGPIHDEVIRSILIEPSQWYEAFSKAQQDVLSGNTSQIFSFGSERCVPPSILRGLAPQPVYVSDRIRRAPAENDIAVVGMSAKVAGADDLEAYWKILCAGQSQHQEVPEERMSFNTVYRKRDENRKWYGNFIQDPDTFDHKFFKRSPREVESMDPQQRQLLQISYQAVEQTGYFHNHQPDVRVGVYMGVCCVDYETNLACHPPNAFTATGHLRGFIAGKVSHYFGWTGPALTIDTACSSSAVAVHQACQAILRGECTSAIAGGTHIMTSPLWFQNLAGASFLSKTGQCKPFDSKADGYCRGEGVAAVYLKKLSDAIVDGNQVFGVISGTAVQQNENCTPIVVPNVPSLSDLFESVVDKSKIKPEQITVVEAHGTGTAVGDPVEYNSVRQTLAGSKVNRSKALVLGSVKGLLGHCECTSGILSLIKILLMIQKGVIPPQASFNTLNPTIKASPTDKMQIVTQKTGWNEDFRAALINNYGASGSNASMIITQPLNVIVNNSLPLIQGQRETSDRLPFWFNALDDKSLRAYTGAFRRYLESQELVSLSDVSFNLSRQSNRSLPRSLLFACRSVDELKQQLGSYEKGTSSIASIDRTPSRPLVLCFGGQISKSIGLDRQIYEKVAIFRDHLNRCDRLSKSLGIGSIFPSIFSREPIDDIITLQICLFATQYTCAMCWIDAGAQPVAVVGHSFGELTALCVAGVLSLDDALKMVASRARVIKESWGSDGGSMMAVEGERELVEDLLAKANASAAGDEPAGIACFNGPRSFTVAGSTSTINLVDETRLNDSTFTAGVKTKKLNVTNAFHSTLVEPLKEKLNEATAGLSFKTPSITVVRSTKHPQERSGIPVDNPKTYVADHMRQPVYFSQAIHRISQANPKCIYLEAGTSSTITNIASRALGGAPSGNNHFQSINITTENAWDNLTDATLNLWKAGLNVSFWTHTNAQTAAYKPLLLPPYQFEKARHWLAIKEPPKPEIISDRVGENEMARKIPEKMPKTLLTFVGYQDKERHQARFRVNTMIPEYEKLMTAHCIVHTAPICPATVQMDLAIEGLRELVPMIGSELQLQIHGVENQTPICVDRTVSVWLDLKTELNNTWSFRFSSSSNSKVQDDAGTTHTTGSFALRPLNDSQVYLDFSRYERLTGHERCSEVLYGQGPGEILQGRTIYRTFADIVEYGEQYRGLQRLVGKKKVSAARIDRKYNSKTWFDAHLSDAYCQVVGIWLNCMTDGDPSQIHIARGFEKWIRSPKLDHGIDRPDSYDVLAYHQGPEKNHSYLSDIFVFHPTTGQLLEAILGFNFVRVPRASMVKLLTHLTRDTSSLSSSAVAAPSKPVQIQLPVSQPLDTVPRKITTQDLQVAKPPQKKKEDKPTVDVFPILRAILADLVGIEPESITIKSELADIGVDSLLAMEVMTEIENAFKCTPSMDDFADVTTMAELVHVVQKTLDPNQNAETTGSSDYEEDNSTSPAETVQTDISVGAIDNSDLLGYFAQVLGMEENELSTSVPLRELGVDSLLSMEVRVEIAEKFGFELDEAISLEDMTIDELGQQMNGSQIVTTSATRVSNDAAQEEPTLQAQPTLSSSNTEHIIPWQDILAAFSETKALGDEFITANGCAGYVEKVLPKQTELCILLTLEAFEKIGMSIRTLPEGAALELSSPLPQYKQLIPRLTEMLENDSGLVKIVDINANIVTRTNVPYPADSSAKLMQRLVQEYPQYKNISDLIFYVGSKLSDALTGKTDGVKLIFGCEEGRSLVSGLYGDWIMNICYYKQMEDFLTRLISRLPHGSGPLRILEMGAGTGGTSKWLLPLLSRLNYPVEYTFTDLAPSLVAAARKTFKPYSSFMKFRQHDIENDPPEDLIHTQHLVVASNAVHATHSLVRSASRIRKALLPNGVLMMLEMIEPLYWIDMIFGLFAGWWFFDDGRTHALTPPARWKTDLQEAGFGRVDWSDGVMPENTINKVIIAVACEQDPADTIVSPPPSSLPDLDLLSDRKSVIYDFVRKYTMDFDLHSFGSDAEKTRGRANNGKACVAVTGATGSVGAHVVAMLSQRPDVAKVICLNRRNNNQDARHRQLQSLNAKGLFLSDEALDKLYVLETDMAKPELGLDNGIYNNLVQSVTHIIHNAWVMSIKRPLKGFEAQFRIMHNLIGLAIDISSRTKITVAFQFISSIATVGHYPIWKQDPHVPDERLPLEAVLPIGYADAKYVCELMLDQTLHRYPQRFLTSTVRLGQVSGSKISGYWNPVEHLSFLFKSAQTINALPDLEGFLSWTPVDDVAGTLIDLLFVDRPYPVYNIDNPVRQQWQDMLPILADALGIPPKNILSFENWVALMREFPENNNTSAGKDTNNPATVLADFLDKDFRRMSCGGLLLDSTKSQGHSITLRAVTPISPELIKKSISYWRSIKFMD